MASILTNTSSMVALQTLKQTNKGMAQIQNQISTGLKVSTAKDNSSTWAISQVMKSDVSGFKAVAESLDLGNATAQVARVATEEVTKLLGQAKEKIIGAGDLANDESKTKLMSDLSNLGDQIDTILKSSSFNGVNMIANVDANGDLATGGANADVVSSLKRDSSGALTTEVITLTHNNLGYLGAAITGDAAVDGALATKSIGAVLREMDFTNAETVDSALAKLEAITKVAIDASAEFGSKQKQIEIQGTFVSNMKDALNNGIGAMIDADMEEASARLQALQVQQQLGIQALSMANQAPQSVLSLFR